MKNTPTKTNEHSKATDPGKASIVFDGTLYSDDEIHSATSEIAATATLAARIEQIEYFIDQVEGMRKSTLNPDQLSAYDSVLHNMYLEHEHVCRTLEAYYEWLDQ